jgi:hypothetical protein
MTDGVGYSLSDIATAMGNRNGEWGNSWWPLILLFLIFGWGNNRRNDAASTGEVAQGFADNRILSKQDAIINGLCDGFYAQNTNLLQGFSALGREIADNRFASQQCCCETNRNIDHVRYDAAKNTCDITTNATANTQKILDKLCVMESNAKDQRIADLTASLQTANFQLSQQAQSANIIGTLRPFPQPAYITASPYEAFYPRANTAYGYNYNCGCGCGY